MMITQKIKEETILFYDGYIPQPGIIPGEDKRVVREELWLLFVQSAGLRQSMANPSSAICVVRSCPLICQKKPENIVRIAQQKLLTGKRSPVPDVVFSFCQKSP